MVAKQEKSPSIGNVSKVMTNIGLFMSSKVSINNEAVVVLNSYLKDGKPKFKETIKNMKKYKDIIFSSSDSNQYIYLTEEQFINLVNMGLVKVDDSGKFLQLELTASVAPTTIGSRTVSLEDLGLSA